MTVPLACADFTFPLLPHDQSLQLIAMLGFDGVDIGLFEGRSHLWPSTELNQPEASGGELAIRLSDLSLRCADVFLQLHSDFHELAINHPEPARRAKARDGFERTLQYALAAGAEHITILPGAQFDQEPTNASWQRCIDELEWRLERAGGCGVTLSIEGHVGSIAPDPHTLTRLLNEVKGLTLTLDYTHFTRSGLSDAEAESLLSSASHFHVRGAKTGRLQTSFAANTIDYGRIVELLVRQGYPGFLGVEYVWIDWEHCNEVDNLSETILFRDFLRERLADAES